MLFCTTAVEWCLTAWGATFVQDATDVGTDTAVAAMGGFFGGFVAGRVLGSRLARRHDPSRLLGLALVVATLGFAVLWPSANPAQAVVGLAVLGVGVGNLFPMGVSVTLAVAPGQAGLASSRAVGASSFSIVLAPVSVGALADATSLTAALLAVPVLVVCAGVALAALSRARRVTASAGSRPAGGR